jgi:uncharacterized protein YejL (UPF0352 family)
MTSANEFMNYMDEGDMYSDEEVKLFDDVSKEIYDILYKKELNTDLALIIAANVLINVMSAAQDLAKDEQYLFAAKLNRFLSTYLDDRRKGNK